MLEPQPMTINKLKCKFKVIFELWIVIISMQKNTLSVFKNDLVMLNVKVAKMRDKKLIRGCMDNMEESKKNK